MSTIKDRTAKMEFRLVSQIAGDQASRGVRSFVVQMFGTDSAGTTYALNITGFEPYFYVKVPQEWDEDQIQGFTDEVTFGLERHSEDLTAVSIVERRKLYGFDQQTKHKFLRLRFRTEAAFKKAKTLWYSRGRGQRRLLPRGLTFDGSPTELYEAHIPPLLRLFHKRQINPAGWVKVTNVTPLEKRSGKPRTLADVEGRVAWTDVTPIEADDPVPYKICSFDIEASSSHGDFPLAKKTYAKLARTVVDLWDEGAPQSPQQWIRDAVCTALSPDCDPARHNPRIDRVFTKDTCTADRAEQLADEVLKAVAPDEFAPPPEYSAVNDDENDVEEEGPAANARCEETGGWFGNGGNRNKLGQLTVIDVLASTASYDAKVTAVDALLSKTLPPVAGDIVTFIGSTFSRYGDPRPYRSHCAALGECETPSDVPNVDIEVCKTESDVLMAWQQVIEKENPDIVIGYNIFGFDYRFLYDRACELGISGPFMMLSRNRGESCISDNWRSRTRGLEETTISIASGTHELRYARMPGRIQIDLYNYLRREFSLLKYNLDYAAGYFIGDRVEGVGVCEGSSTLTTPNVSGLDPGSYISLTYQGDITEPYNGGEKLYVSSVVPGAITVRAVVELKPGRKVKWGLVKDDIGPKEIFALARKGPREKAIVAKYCIQDCNLVHHLLSKIDVVTGYLEMSRLCSVPMDYLVLRGQGIKLTSYLAKECREKGILMPVIDKDCSDSAYEGGLVVDPVKGMYATEAVACVDYASLYPSFMRSDNISHDTKVWAKTYDLDGKLVAEEGETVDGVYVHDNLPGYEYVDTQYDLYKWRTKQNSAAREKVLCGRRECRWVQARDADDGGVMPTILAELYKARKATKKEMGRESDEFRKNLLDKRQLSIKVTMNSMYGGTGAKTSSFAELDCAASTTAGGRMLLLYAKTVVEEAFVNTPVNTSTHGVVSVTASCVYGDTDSVFFKLRMVGQDGRVITGKEGLALTIEIAQVIGNTATKFLKPPHELEYEKTFLPSIFAAKKRYVGMLYEFDPNKGKRKEMGLSIKRRDSAPYLREVFGGVLDRLMEADVEGAVDYLDDCLMTLATGKCPTSKLILTRSLAARYKKPHTIAHNVLANRIARRDPGSKPRVGDRVAFLFVTSKNPKALQGERIETPQFVADNKLQIDYKHYITNQLQKPISQILGLILEKTRRFRLARSPVSAWREEIAAIYERFEGDAADRKETSLRGKEVKRLFFQESIAVAEKAANKVHPTKVRRRLKLVPSLALAEAAGHC